MKKILFTLVSLALIVSCSQNKEKEETANKIQLGEAYGPVKVDTSQAMTVQEFFSDFEQKEDSATYTVEGKIVTMCDNAGCWVGIDNGNDDYFMVNFKDHFTIPLDTKMGTEAYFHGVAAWDSTTVEELKAVAIEEGKNQEEIDLIVEPEYSFSFVADGIVLKK